MPVRGDFVRRGLDDAFIARWDAWLQPCLRDVVETLLDFEQLSSAAPAWCFRLPAGACTRDAIAGVLVASTDQIGRPFPLTLVRLLRTGELAPTAEWYEC